MLPTVLQKIMATKTFLGEPSEGGLFHPTFLPLDTSGKQLAPRESDGTLFYKTTEWTDALDAELADSLANAYDVAKSTKRVLAITDHFTHAKKLDGAPHGSVHVAVGELGNRVPGTEMVGSIPTAGFHPCFWMHQYAPTPRRTRATRSTRAALTPVIVDVTFVLVSRCAAQLQCRPRLCAPSPPNDQPQGPLAPAPTQLPRHPGAHPRLRMPSR
jgi:hypothetical protein